MSRQQVYLETFGCQMNELDSELVAGQLRASATEFTSNRNEADVVIYNTCSVREQAEQKVWSRLGEVGRQESGARCHRRRHRVHGRARRDRPDRRMPQSSM
jgi:tRNA A37 methylthiotransferase MiaB